MPLNVQRNLKNYQGFTLIEWLVVLVIIGILAAIAIPSFLAYLQRAKLNNALAQVRGALQEAQREAIRKSKICTVTLDRENNQLTGCLVTGDRQLPNGVVMVTNTPGSQITYGVRGSTASSGTIVLSLLEGSAEKKCLVISLGTGILRTGTYSGNPFRGRCSTTE